MIMADLKRELGLTHEQAAGLVGNLGYESAGFKALQEGRPISGAGGFGYAQWTGPRRRKFMQYAQQRGLDPKSHEANVGFLKHELTGEHSGFLRRLKQTKTLQEATRLTHEVYDELRPTCSRNIGGNTSLTRPRPVDCNTQNAPTPWAAAKRQWPAQNQPWRPPQRQRRRPQGAVRSGARAL